MNLDGIRNVSHLPAAMIAGALVGHERKSDVFSRHALGPKCLVCEPDPVVIGMTRPRNMTMSHANGILPAELTRLLFDIRRQLRAIAVIRGMGMLLVLLVAGIWGGILCDLQWDSPIQFRILMPTLLLAGGVVLVWTQVLRPLFRRHTLPELAAIVEKTHPEFAERLTSAIELTDPAIPERERGSALMRELLLQQTVKRVHAVDCSDAVPTVAAWRWAIAGSIAVLLFLAPVVIAPTTYQLALKRFVTPWGNFDSVGTLSFKIENPNRVVARGSDVDLKILVSTLTPSQPSPQTLWFHWTTATGETGSRRIHAGESPGNFLLTVPHIHTSLNYRIAADTQRSREYALDVVDAPALVRAGLEIAPPAYTGMPLTQIDGVLGDIPVLAHSRLSFHLGFNKPIERADLEWLTSAHVPDAASVAPPNKATGSNSAQGSATTDELTSGELPTGGLPTEPAILQRREFTIADDGLSATLEMIADVQGRFAFRIADEHQLANRDEPRRAIVLIADRPPQIQIAGSAGQSAIRPGDTPTVGVDVIDDFGVSNLELRYSIDGGEEQRLSAEIPEYKNRQVSHEFRLDPQTLALAEGSVIQYRVVATDERAAPGPNEVSTEPRSFVVSSDSESPTTQQLAESQQELQEMLDDIRQQLAEHREQVEQLAKDADKSDAEDAARQAAQQAAMAAALQQERDLAEKLETLSRRFAENPLLAPLSPATQAVAREQLDQASRNLQQASDATGENTGQALEAAQDQVAQAQKKLDSIDQQFDRLSEILDDLLELEQLAQRADELARDAASALDHNTTDRNASERNTAEQLAAAEQSSPTGSPADSPAGDTPMPPQSGASQSGESPAGQSAEIAQLQEQHAKLTEDLNDLLDRRPELVNAARRDQLDRLAELAKQARNLAIPQENLANGLAAESEQPQGIPPTVPEANTNNTQAAADQAATGQSATDRAATDQAVADQTPTNQTPDEAAVAVGSLMQAQRDLARESARLAVQIAREKGGQSEAAQQALEVAQASVEGYRQSQAGKLTQAEQEARRAAAAAEQAARSLDPSVGTPKSSRGSLAESAQALGERQNALAERLAEMATSPPQRNAARAQGQRELAAATQRLAGELDNVADQLSDDPVSMAESGETARQAGQNASQAQSSMQQTLSELANSAPRQAATPAHQAAEFLKSAADLADGLREENESISSPVPGQIGSDVVEAAQQLRQAGEMLAQNSQPKPPSATGAAEDGKSQGSPAGASPESNGQPQPGEQQASGEQSGAGSTSSGQPGEAGSQGQQSLASLQQVAQSLAQAARQLSGQKPGPSSKAGRAQSGNQNQPGEPGTQQSSSGGSGESGYGGVDGVDLVQLQLELANLSGRNWGELPSTLRTEILQGAQRTTHADYARLIELYFQEISESTMSQAPPTGSGK